MKLTRLMSDLNDDKQYRFHMAKTEPKGGRPIDALAKSEDEWLGWQVYKGKAKERFPKEFIVSFAQISGNKFLFGGIFKITDRASNKYKVEYTENHKDLIGKLVLDFNGKNKRATVFTPSYIFKNSKIAGIHEYRFKGEPFISFEKINHDFNAIEIIIKNALPDWKVALSSVHGIYLITDRKTGKHYIGSAYGKNGIWGRWQSYVNTFHGTNKDLKELFSTKKASYFRNNFNFSILEVISASVTKENVIDKETLWKQKLFSRAYGYNCN